MSIKHDDDASIPLAPMTDRDLLRRYAAIAAGYNEDLPRLRADVRAAKDAALAAFEAMGRLAAEQSELRTRLEDVARAVGAKPTLPPPPVVPQHVGHHDSFADIDAEPTLHGTRMHVSKSDFEMLKSMAAIGRAAVRSGRRWAGRAAKWAAIGALTLAGHAAIKWGPEVLRALLK